MIQNQNGERKNGFQTGDIWNLCPCLHCCGIEGFLPSFKNSAKSHVWVRAWVYKLGGEDIQWGSFWGLLAKESWGSTCMKLTFFPATAAKVGACCAPPVWGWAQLFNAWKQVHFSRKDSLWLWQSGSREECLFPGNIAIPMPKICGNALRWWLQMVVNNSENTAMFLGCLAMVRQGFPATLCDCSTSSWFLEEFGVAASGPP